MGAIRSLIAALLISATVHAQDTPFEKARLVPDILQAPPAAKLTVTYADGLSVEDGNELTPTQVKEAPTVTWEADPNKLYTLLMSDPDAPSRLLPLLREVRHWLVVNIPGNQLQDGEIISGYMGSGPPQGTGLHRYVFLVYEQPGTEYMEFADEVRDPGVEDPKGRMRFSTKAFATKYNLGAPIAGTFFEAKWDESVPPLKEQLAGLKARGVDVSALEALVPKH